MQLSLPAYTLAQQNEHEIWAQLKLNCPYHLQVQPLQLVDRSQQEPSF